MKLRQFCQLGDTEQIIHDVHWLFFNSSGPHKAPDHAPHKSGSATSPRIEGSAKRLQIVQSASVFQPSKAVPFNFDPIINTYSADAI
jgi:hypothetical protein